MGRFLKFDDIFFDVGANAGALSVLAASLECKVFAFEPVPKTYARLVENISLNSSVCKIQAINKAVSSEAGIIWMTTELSTGNRELMTGETIPSIDVQTITVDALASEYGSPYFVKIDVEGHEAKVIRGAKTTLSSTSLLGLMVETFRSANWKLDSLKELEKALSDAGFNPYDYDARSNKLVRLSRPDDGGDNTFYFRDIAMVERRLAHP